MSGYPIGDALVIEYQMFHPGNPTALTSEQQ
jgi:hypothetical protein